jgi:hypothetical protein
MHVLADASLRMSMLVGELNGNFDADTRVFCQCAHRMRISTVPITALVSLVST